MFKMFVSAAAVRRTARRIRSAKSVPAGELVSRQCPSRIKLTDFFNILLEGDAS